MARSSVFMIAVGLFATLLPAVIQAAAIVPTTGAEVVRGNARNFKFIGSHNNSPQIVRGSTQQTTSYYFLSQNAAAYVTAANDCKAFLGDDATLLYIETQEELGNVTKFMQDNDDTGSSYWVGGRYDTGKASFIWENGAEIGPWAPWDQGHPDTRTQLTRVYIKTVGGIVFRTQFNTLSTRYICELKTGESEEEAEPCYDDNDLAIVVDSSGSVGETHYKVALEFTVRLGIAWADNPRNRLAVSIYANDAQSIITLNENLTVSEIRDKVYKAPFLHGSFTGSDVALKHALQQFQQNPRNVPNNMVFLTDGESRSEADTVAAAKLVHAAGIRAFSVGIGPRLRPSELLAIADGNPNHVFNTDGFDDLLKLLRPISLKVCDK